jgi:hypothetical protein
MNRAVLLPLALLSLQAPAPDFRIDHVTIAGANLEHMREAFSAATGISPEYGGPHANHATEMALVSFPDGSYLELMGIQTAADPQEVAAHTWSRFLRNNLGPCAFALRVDDVGAEVSRLKAEGVRVGAPEKSGRKRPDGFALSWETADVGDGVRGSLFPFLIRDFTPREKRVYPGGSPTAPRFNGVVKVVIGVANLEDAIAQYRKAYGLAEPRRQTDEAFSAELAWFEGTPFVLARGTGAATWLAQRVAAHGPAPCAFILGGSGGPMTELSSDWFGRTVKWADEERLGWRLGFER